MNAAVGSAPLAFAVRRAQASRRPEKKRWRLRWKASMEGAGAARIGHDYQAYGAHLERKAPQPAIAAPGADT